MTRNFLAASVVLSLGVISAFVASGVPKEPRPPVSPEQGKEIDAALDAYIRFLESFETVRVEYAATSVEMAPAGEVIGERYESRSVVVLKKPGMLREESFRKGVLSSVDTYDRNGKLVSWSKTRNETYVEERTRGPLHGREAEKDSLPVGHYPFVYAFSFDVGKRQASLKRLAVSAGVEDLDGVPCRVIAFRGLGTRRSRESERARLWIGPDGAPVRCLYEDDRPDDITAGQINRFTWDTRFTAVKTGVEAPDSLFTFVPPKGGKVLTEEDMMDPAKLLLLKGEAAPDIACVDLAGKTVRLSDFKGKTVLLNFWGLG